MRQDKRSTKTAQFKFYPELDFPNSVAMKVFLSMWTRNENQQNF